MRNATRMMMLNRGRNGQTDVRYPHMGGYGMENRNGSYDRGAETGGRTTRGTLTWDNTRGAEGAYRGDYGGMNQPRYEMDEPESRRRRDSRGRFRSEMDEPDANYPDMNYPDMNYPDMSYPMYPPPVYEDYGRMNRIGFAAHNGSERNNLHMIRGGSSEKSGKLDEKTVEKWMRGLQNEDGTIGPHWTKEQTTQVMKQKNVDCDPMDFYIAMNIMYSDYYSAAKKANANNVDFYVNMAKAFLDDKDAGTEDKLSAYYYNIVK